MIRQKNTQYIITVAEDFECFVKTLIKPHCIVQSTKFSH